jgi:hypothetical protein
VLTNYTNAPQSEGLDYNGQERRGQSDEERVNGLTPKAFVNTSLGQRPRTIVTWSYFNTEGIR